MDFRPATVLDIPFITDTYNASIPARMATADTENISPKTAAEWIERQQENRPIWIVSEGHEDIGYLHFKNFYGRPAYRATAEISIYLTEDFQGKGYGKAILRHAMEKAPGLGIETLLAFVFSHNEASLRLVKGGGFALWGQLPDVAIMDGKHYSLHILGKKLT